MDTLGEDLDDSALFCKSLIQKRKAIGNGNPKNPKQLRLQFSQSSSETNQPNQGKQNSTVNPSGDKISSTSSLNSKLDESRSSYFSTRKSANTCPLCLKSFKTDSAYSGHMKNCAKTHKMTTQQLLGALELQKKQMQERRNMGLCSQKASSPPKITTKKKKEKDAEQYDLALGLALSRSLSSGSSQTLEEFGFTSKNTVVGPSRRKNDAAKKAILRERTVEERQRIIIEKVAVVLLDEEQGEKFTKNQNLNSSSQTANDEIPQLWNMGENNEKGGWYVDGIKKLVLLDEVNADEKEATKQRNSVSKDEDEKKENPRTNNVSESEDEMEEKKQTNPVLKTAEEKEESTQKNSVSKSTAKKEENTRSNSVSGDIEMEISGLNLPHGDIHKDWGKMINNSRYSDFAAKTKDCEDVHLHSLVLFARSPELLGKDCRSVFGKFNLSTIIVFLEFVYCGTLNGLTRTEVDTLMDLAVEFDYGELMTVLNRLKSRLVDCGRIADSPPRADVTENEVKHPVIESKRAEILEDRDLFTEDDVVDLTQNSNESNAEKSYWSFIQHEKKKSEEVRDSSEKTPNGGDEENKLTESSQVQRLLSDDSTTRDLDDELKKSENRASSDCIVLSTGSDSKTQEDLGKPPARTPSPAKVDYDVPEFDPYDNLNFFSEEQFSPVGVHSQSLITGDVSMESVKSSDLGREPKKPVGYCSTPVTVHHSDKAKCMNSQGRSRRGKLRDLSASRIVRKSLGLQHKRRLSNSGKKPNSKRKDSRKERDLAEALTSTILRELSKSSVFESSPLPAARRGMFVEMTPVSGRDEFVDTVTPSPNYSNMGESLIKEQLTKYGLKKNLAKSKAKKILRYIYEELHPLYNTETGKIVKKIGGTPKPGKKTKSKPKQKSDERETAGKSKRIKRKNNCSSSKESVDASGRSSDGLTDYDSDESEFEGLNETLTQSTPSNPVDLASAFCDFLESNPDYHQKILLYEPIWLEELQKKLREAFKKHFKIADLMDFLDQKCITFRSEAQARRNEKRKENLKKKKNPS